MNVQTSDDKNLAVLTHISGIFLSVLVPLIVWLVNKDNTGRDYLNTEAKEALNFQITVALGYFVAAVLTPIGIGLLIGPLVWIANAVFCILAAVETSKGRNYRYPLTLRLLS